MSTLRRAACGKWPAPMAKPSPSPPTAMTLRSGFASFTPIATGRGRPWRLWKPYVETKPGRRLEQPMPETTTVFAGSRSSSRERPVEGGEDTEVTAARAPDGLQVRLVVGGLALGGVGAQRGDPFHDDVQDVVGGERQAVALGVALDREAALAAHEARELPGEVDLEHDDPPGVGGEALDLVGGERPEHAAGRRRPTESALGTGEVDRLAHRAVRRAEADERDLRLRVAVELVAGERRSSADRASPTAWSASPRGSRACSPGGRTRRARCPWRRSARSPRRGSPSARPSPR